MDKLRDARESTARFLRSSRFNPRHKTKVHILQICLVIAVFIFTGARIATKPSGMPVTRSDTLGIVMGVKTIVVLLYQILTSKVERFQRWKSLKANTILNSMEIVFWFVVVIITLMGISRFCQGAFCALSWIQVLVAIMLMIIAFWTAVVSYHLQHEPTAVKSQSTFVSPEEPYNQRPWNDMPAPLHDTAFSPQPPRSYAGWDQTYRRDN